MHNITGRFLFSTHSIIFYLLGFFLRIVPKIIKFLNRYQVSWLVKMQKLEALRSTVRKCWLLYRALRCLSLHWSWVDRMVLEIMACVVVHSSNYFLILIILCIYYFFSANYWIKKLWGIHTYFTVFLIFTLLINNYVVHKLFISEIRSFT